MPQPAHIGVHLGGVHLDLALVVVISGLAAALLAALGLTVYRRRRSRTHLLVVLALGVLLAQPLVAVLSAAAVLQPEVHHTLEHGLDALLVALVFAAVWLARSVERRPETEQP